MFPSLPQQQQQGASALRGSLSGGDRKMKGTGLSLDYDAQLDGMGAQGECGPGFHEVVGMFLPASCVHSPQVVGVYAVSDSGIRVICRHNHGAMGALCPLS